MYKRLAGPEIADLTNQAMEGGLDLTASIEARMKLLNPTPKDIRGYLRANRPEDRLVPHAKELVQALLLRYG